MVKKLGDLFQKDATVSYLTDSLTGILQEDYDLDEAKEESLREKNMVLLVDTNIILDVLLSRPEFVKRFFYDMEIM